MSYAVATAPSSACGVLLLLHAAVYFTDVLWHGAAPLTNGLSRL